MSRQLYRLRFELQLFNKLAMHTFYLVASFLLMNTIHLVMRASTLSTTNYVDWLQLANIPASELPGEIKSNDK